MPLGSRKRSQRKASGLANAAITLQSADGYDGSSAGPSLGGISTAASSSRLAILNRPLTVRERQLLDEERQEKEDREVSVKRRKLQKRLDELERTNYRDAIGASAARAGGDSSRGHDGESFSIPNSALAAARSRQEEDRGSSRSASSSNIRASADVEAPEGSHSKKRADATTKQSAAVRRLLTYRRGFYALLEEASGDEVFIKSPWNYLTASSAAETTRLAQQDQKTTNAASKVSLYPTKPLFCAICNDAGSTDCPRCGQRTCSRLSCLETHNDTRCDRPIR